MTQEALKELLEAVEAAIQAGDWKVDGACDPDSVIKRSKEALAEHVMREVQRLWQEIEQEPLAITNEMAFAFHGALTDGAIGEGEVEEIKAGLAAAFAHITTPPQRTWVGLTDEEIDYFIVHRLTIATKNNLVALIRICEAKFKEKNQ